MEVTEKHSPSLYALGPPWMFKGSALYQIHLVKAETARAFIPKRLRLVEAFGYTLGGFFLAHYDDSPAGMFDELVVIAGIVWDPPTSCGWAARVLVNSNEACRHGKKEIGLPSHVGIFSKRLSGSSEKPTKEFRGSLSMTCMGFDNSEKKEQTEIQVSEIKGSSEMSICNISLPFFVPKSERDNQWMGPRIKMLLPSFRVRAVKAAKVRGPAKTDVDKVGNNLKSNYNNRDDSISLEDEAWSRSISVLLSKPILALEFNRLTMRVDMPSIVDSQPMINMARGPGTNCEDT